MREGDVVVVKIDKLGGSGDGVAEISGRPLYVPRVLPGEQVRVTLGKPLGQGFQVARQDILSPSLERQPPVCGHFAQCGGCAMQHFAEEPYYAWKREIVVTALAQHRLGDVRVLPTLKIPPATRRRLTMAAVAAGGRVLLGYNARASHQIVDVAECAVARPELIALLPRLRQVLGPWLRKVKTLDVSLTLADNGIDILLTGKAPDLEAREVMATLSADEASVARVSWRLNERAEAEPMLALREPYVTLGGHRVVLPVGSFLQPSQDGEKMLTAAVLAALPEGQTRIADLFAGCGTFSLPLSAVAPVWAVEGYAPALAALPKLRDITATQRDLFRDPVMADELKKFSAVVFDPPRAGAAAQASELAKSAVPTVVAVSCNPGTLARDAETLVKGGYTLEWVQPVDQFLWSGHVECVAKFSRSKVA